MRISDWSSDVCSSDLPSGALPRQGPLQRRSAQHGPAAYRRNPGQDYRIGGHGKDPGRTGQRLRWRRAARLSNIEWVGWRVTLSATVIGGSDYMTSFLLNPAQALICEIGRAHV